MSKEKIYLEYPLKGSAAMIWKFIGSSAGLSPWFADKVENIDRTFSFYWGKTEKKGGTPGSAKERCVCEIPLGR